MNKNFFSKEKLQTFLMIVSIITVTLIGLYVLNLLAANIIQGIGAAARSVLIPFFLAFFLSFIIGPFSNLIHKTTKIPKRTSIVLSIFIGFIVLGGMFFLIFSFFISQVLSIFQALLTYFEGSNQEAFMIELIQVIQAYFQDTHVTEIWEQISSEGVTFEKLMNYVGSIFVFISGAASNLFEAIFSIVLTPVFLYYLIKEKSLIFESIVKIFPKTIKPHAIELGKRSETVIGQYFRGQGLMMLITALYFGTTLSILSFFIPEFMLGYAIAFGLISGIMTIIPYIGAWISLSVPIIFLFTKHLEIQATNEGQMIYVIAIIIVLVIYLIEQLLEGSVIQPYVMNKQVHIHPLVVISSLIFFGGIFGFIGVLLAVPLAGLLRALFQYIGELNSSKEKPSKKLPNPIE
ncbi:MAG: AI-2E family transporter [Acholeplasmataceae bacterium]|nr:AI-2E family transporter [Acholeplasmataceae bacterium]